MVILHRASPAVRLFIAVALVAGAYAFALHERLHDVPDAFSGFGFHPEALVRASASTRMHVGAGALAVALGLLQLALPKGTPRHRPWAAPGCWPCWPCASAR